jgi:hypothetical protein
MKFLSNRALILVLVSSTFLMAATSCKKSSSGGGGSTGLSASVGGTAWAVTYPVQAEFVSSAGQFGILGLQTKAGDSTVFTIGFTSPVTLNKAFNSDSLFTISIDYSDLKTSVDYLGAYGSGHSVLTITSYDSTGHKIGGTFSGVLYNTGGTDSLVITNGSFNTSFIAQ